MHYDSDEEQIALLKRLWQDYGWPVLAGVLITLGSVLGYKAWKQHQYDTAVAASQLYQNLLDTLQKTPNATLSAEQTATRRYVVDNLQKDYANSRYAAFATLFQAQQLVRDNALDKAAAALRWILQQHPDEAVDTITRTRLARVLLGQIQDSPPATETPVNYAQQALEVLSAVATKPAFTASVEAVKGDAYRALGQHQQARAAYQKALTAAQTDGEAQPWLQWQLDNLPAPAASAAQTVEG